MTNPIPDKLKTHFMSLYHLAFSDLDFAPEELEILYQIGYEHGVSHVELEDAILRPVRSIVIPENDEEKVAYLYDYARLIVSDGKIEPAERQSFERFCERFGIGDSAVRNRFMDELFDAAKKHKTISEVIQTIAAQ